MSDYLDTRFLDYIAAHETGFACLGPVPPIIGFDDAVRNLVYGTRLDTDRPNARNSRPHVTERGRWSKQRTHRMAGWADKAKSGGGSSVEGVITDYKFMDVFPFGEDNEPDGNIYMLLEITPDGADEPAQRSLYLGSGQFLVISDDGKTLTSTDDDGAPRLYDQGEVFKFICSLEDAGFPAEARFPDPSETKTIDFSAMIGTRLRLSNEIDEEATKKFGKRKVTKGKHKGKEFNRTYTKVTKVLEIPEEGGAAKKNGKTKAGAAKTTGKGKPAPVVEDEDGDDEEATLSNKQLDKILVAVLKKQGKNNSIERGALALAVTRYYAATKGDNDERDIVRKQVVDEDWLTEAAEREVVEFDASSKKQVVTVA